MSEVPKSTFGGGRESAPRIAIGENGQIRFSTVLTKDVIGNCDKLYLTFDPETRRLGLRPVLTAPKGVAEEDLQEIKRGNEGKIKQAYFGAAGLLTYPGCGIEYDYKASGTQMFTPEIEAGKNNVQTMYITVPKGSLPLRPKQTRAKKVTAPVTPVAAKAAAPVADDEDDDI